MGVFVETFQTLVNFYSDNTPFIPDISSLAATGDFSFIFLLICAVLIFLSLAIILFKKKKKYTGTAMIVLVAAICLFSCVNINFANAASDKFSVSDKIDANVDFDNNTISINDATISNIIKFQLWMRRVQL